MSERKSQCPRCDEFSLTPAKLFDTDNDSVCIWYCPTCGVFYEINPFQPAEILIWNRAWSERNNP